MVYQLYNFNANNNYLCFFFTIEISRIYHVFCILKLGGQALETGLVEVDHSVTDVTLEDVVVL